MSDRSVTVVTKGAALVKDGTTLSGFQIVERVYEFDSPLEFGKFLGPNDVSMRVKTRERDLRIPTEARDTWNITKVKGSDPSLYDDWAEQFADSKIGTRGLNKRKVLLYWLQRTQDETIVEILEE